MSLRRAVLKKAPVLVYANLLYVCAPAHVGSTHSLFFTIDGAPHVRQVADWATTIACCYSGVLKLSYLSRPTRVYRGVKEDERVLPDGFVTLDEDKFAGGVERAFMSTTRSPEVALDYSGGGRRGSIFAIDFDMASRGAAVQWLSQCAHAPFALAAGGRGVPKSLS